MTDISDADKIREIGRALGIDTTGTPAQIARRVRRFEARYNSANVAPRDWRRSEAKAAKQGRKGAKARAKMQRAEVRRFGPKKK